MVNLGCKLLLFLESQAQPSPRLPALFKPRSRVGWFLDQHCQVQNEFFFECMVRLFLYLKLATAGWG